MSCSLVANVLDFYIVVSEFELQLRYYVLFRTNTLKKGMNFIIPPAVGKIVALSSYENGFGIKWFTEVDISLK